MSRVFSRLTDLGKRMPSTRGGRLRRRGCSLVRRAQRRATAAWRLLYRLLFMVSRGSECVDQRLVSCSLLKEASLRDEDSAAISGIIAPEGVEIIEAFWIKRWKTDVHAGQQRPLQRVREKRKA